MSEAHEVWWTVIPGAKTRDVDDYAAIPVYSWDKPMTREEAIEMTMSRLRAIVEEKIEPSPMLKRALTS